MLSEFDDLETDHGAEKRADVQKACRYLLRFQFAYSGDRGAATVYNTLTDNRFRRIIDGFFDSIGYRLHRNGEEQWAGILLDEEDTVTAPRMRIDQTIVVLVLASHWQENADLGDLHDRAVAVTTANVLYERYTDILPNPGKPTLSIGRFVEILRDIATRNLITLGDFDHEAQDREIVIRPMIKFVSGADALARLETYVGNEERGARGRAMPGIGRLLDTDQPAAEGETA